jgi:Mor family transcriptional regulator
MKNTDLLDEIFSAISTRAALDRESLRPVEREIRARWAGDRAYIRADQSVERTLSILRDHAQGDRPAELARRYKVSRRQVQRLVRSSNG